MSRSLPDKPNLDHLRNEARSLLKAHAAGDAGACAVLRHVERLSDLSDGEILSGKVSLQEVQHALARDYGFGSWKDLRDSVVAIRVNRLTAEASKVLASKGPEHNSTRSDWDRARIAEVDKLLGAGEEGFEVAERLAASPNGRLRWAATGYFAGTRDPRGLEHLKRLLSDESVRIRLSALRGYAARIHPGSGFDPGWGMGLRQEAGSVPEGLEVLIELLDDRNWRVKREAVFALTAYTKSGDRRVQSALEKALADPEHPVHHAAAKALGVPCPGCGAELERGADGHPEPAASD
jgi:HEAT repeat protein